MKLTPKGLFLCIMAATLLFSQTVNLGDARLSPRLLNYQGYLTDTLGNPITGSFATIFSIYDAPSGGNLKWSENQALTAGKGIFHILLGAGTPIPDSVFQGGTSRWLELNVASIILSPRTRIVSAPYAYTATYSDTAQFARNSAPDNDWSFRITDGADTTLQTGGRWGLARAGNVLWGNADSTHVTLGVACTTGTSGVNHKYCTVAGGLRNIARIAYATVGGGYRNTAGGYVSTVGGGYNNNASADYAVIGGGYNNAASDWYSTISGGGDNIADYYYATVGGGSYNTADGDYATVGGGRSNTANGAYATAGGGYIDTASGDYATAGGGRSNTASGDYATVGGGYYNKARAVFSGALSGGNNYAGVDSTDSCAVVSGGRYNYARAIYSSVAGGYSNTAGGRWSAVGGGYAAIANGDYATIGGGRDNIAGYDYATVGGGYYNTADGLGATVGGGYVVTANGDYATAGGGGDNNASGYYATVGGGCADTASGDLSTVGGGYDNTASGYGATVGGGYGATASGYYATVGGGRSNTASGYYATVGGGSSNTASGYYSFAGGRRAKAYAAGTFVWGDTTNVDLLAWSVNSWIARCSGGVYFYTNGSLSSGVYVPSGGNAWSSVCDRNMKENFQPVNGAGILDKLARMSITTWNYKSQNPSVRHIGPMAQDFAEFGVGEDDKHITTIDADGVALAAIQELTKLVRNQQAEIEQLKAQIKEIKK